MSRHECGVATVCFFSVSLKEAVTEQSYEEPVAFLRSVKKLLYPSSAEDDKPSESRIQHKIGLYKAAYSCERSLPLDLTFFFGSCLINGRLTSVSLSQGYTRMHQKILRPGSHEPQIHSADGQHNHAGEDSLSTGCLQQLPTGCPTPCQNGPSF